MTTASKHLVAGALCAILTVSPLMGCASTTPNAGNATVQQDELDKEGEDVESKGKKIPYSRQGEYTVTLGESDFQVLDRNAEPGTDASEKKEENKDGKEESKTRTLGDIKAEDVKVYYAVLTNRDEVEADGSEDAEAKYEIREARVNTLDNDNGTITVSFTDPDAASNITSSYDVTIESLDKYAPVRTELVQPQLTVESGIASDSESGDVTIKAENDKFSSELSAGDLKLGGSFEGMSVTGAEPSGDALVVHLSGTPKIDREATSVYADGQVVVPAAGFENSALAATALVPVDLPAAAFDLGEAEELPTATATGDVDYSTIDGDTGKATVYLSADLGSFNDVKPESITLEDGFAGGKVESVSKEGDDGTYKVELTFPANGQSADDYLLAGTIKLEAGAMSDETGKAAPEIESTVTVESGEAMGKDTDAEKKAKEAEQKKREAQGKTIKSYGDAFKYAGSHLKKVDPTLGQIANFCDEALSLTSNLVAGKYVDALKNVDGLLKLVGIMEPDKKEATAADVLAEVKSLRTVVDAIDLKVSDISKEARADRYTQTSVRLKKMQDACTSANVMFNEAAKRLATRKDNPMKAPAKGASNEEIAKYNAELRSFMLQEQEKERKGESKSTMFVDLDKTMTALQDDLSTVSKWVSVDKNAVNAAANPVDVFDKLVAGKFNWDTQGYYARTAFRSEIQYTMVTAWAYLGTYYNYADSSVAPKYQPLADGVAEALKQLTARPAGMSPEKVRELNRAGKDVKVYSPSLGITIKRSRVVTGGQDVSKKSIEDVSDAKINDYKSRMRGSQWQDLELAGLETGNEGDAFDGIGFRHHVEFHADKAWYQVILRSPGISIRESWVTLLQQKPSTTAYKKTSYVSWVQGGRTLSDSHWVKYYWFDRA